MVGEGAVIMAGVVAAGIALTFAYLEALEIQMRMATGRDENLNHTSLVVWRILLLVPCVVLIAGQRLPWGVDALLAAHSAAVFATVHRVALNMIRSAMGTKGIRWNYMGPSIRGSRESWYDTLFWSMCAYSVSGITNSRTPGVVHTRYHVRMPGLPFVAATGFEFLVALSTAIAIIKTSNA